MPDPERPWTEAEDKRLTTLVHTALAWEFVARSSDRSVDEVKARAAALNIAPLRWVLTPERRRAAFAAIRGRRYSGDQSV
jgi:hypothetical protein